MKLMEHNFYGEHALAYHQPVTLGGSVNGRWLFHELLRPLTCLIFYPAGCPHTPSSPGFLGGVAGLVADDPTMNSTVPVYMVTE